MPNEISEGSVAGNNEIEGSGLILMPPGSRKIGSGEPSVSAVNMPGLSRYVTVPSRLRTGSNIESRGELIANDRHCATTNPRKKETLIVLSTKGKMILKFGLSKAHTIMR